MRARVYRVLCGAMGGLLAAARRPALGRGIGTATALALVLMAMHRIFGWMLGGYSIFNELMRSEGPTSPEASRSSAAWGSRGAPPPAAGRSR